MDREQMLREATRLVTEAAAAGLALRVIGAWQSTRARARRRAGSWGATTSTSTWSATAPSRGACATGSSSAAIARTRRLTPPMGRSA
jgi:hypothetical protein